MRVLCISLLTEEMRY